MEATGVYWIPLYDILESRGLKVLLVNARHVKNVPGRKSDVADCEWLRDLLMVGLLRGSFRPTPDIFVLRTYVRHRETARRQLLLPVNDNYFCRRRVSKGASPTTWRRSVRVIGRLVAV